MVQYGTAMQQLGDTFAAMGWAPTLWVHNMVSHGGEVVSTHGSLFHLSSVPTEGKHRPWKRELRSMPFRHIGAGIMHSWERSPAHQRRHLTCCTQRENLDLGLRLKALEGE